MPAPDDLPCPPCDSPPTDPDRTVYGGDCASPTRLPSSPEVAWPAPDPPPLVAAPSPLKEPVPPGPGSRPSLPLPREFGNYVLLRKIAEGGMGVVYEARQKSPDRLVALKMIRHGELAGADDI